METVACGRGRTRRCCYDSSDTKVWVCWKGLTADDRISSRGSGNQPHDYAPDKTISPDALRALFENFFAWVHDEPARGAEEKYAGNRHDGSVPVAESGK
jgi:hypothetical protein